MPSLPRSPFGRARRARGPRRLARRSARRAAREVIETPGLRWINIERPRQIDLAWLQERFEFHPLDYEDVTSRNQRPKVDEYDDYLFIVLHFPRYDKSVGRLNAAEVDLFVGPDFLITLPNEPLQPIEYLFERVPTNEELRESLFSKGPATCSTRSSTTASTPRSRCCARSATSSSGSRRRSSRATRPRSCATSPTSSRRSSTSARSSARSARPSRTSSATRRATSPTTSRSTSRTSTTRPSGCGTCSRTTRRSSRRSRTRTSPRSPTAPTRPSGC